MVAVEEYQTKSVMFAANHTVEAILRLHNPKVEKGPQLKALVDIFNQLNGNVCPTLGKLYEIPIMKKYVLD